MKILEYLPKLEIELRNALNEKKYADCEENIYNVLSKCITFDSLQYFKNILDLASELDIFIDPVKIPKRFKNIQRAINVCVENLQLGGIINILRYVNNYNICYRELDTYKISLVKKIKQDNLLMENLKDLFGEIDNSFIYFFYNDLPDGLYNFFIQTDGIYPGFSDYEEILDQIRFYFNHYSVYGLSVKNLGNISRFLKIFKENTKNSQKIKSTGTSNENVFLTIEIDGKSHLISEHNLKKTLDKMIDPTIYNFYTYSMVLLGGLGPEGHGFTYSTPKGELIEICSDRKESQAIIIKFKKFLKETFLQKLTKELSLNNMSEKSIKEIIQFLVNTIQDKDYIDITKREPLIKKIKSYLFSNIELKKIYKSKIEDFNRKISYAFSVILRPVDLIDQFKCRMNLVAEDKINSEDISKLTKLKDKSHYDVLKERFFFQKIVELFYQRFKSELTNFTKK